MLKKVRFRGRPVNSKAGTWVTGGCYLDEVNQTVKNAYIVTTERSVLKTIHVYPESLCRYTGMVYSYLDTDMEIHKRPLYEQDIVQGADSIPAVLTYKGIVNQAATGDESYGVGLVAVDTDRNVRLITPDDIVVGNVMDNPHMISNAKELLAEDTIVAYVKPCEPTVVPTQHFNSLGVFIPDY